MTRRSNISPLAVIKNIRRVAPHPWIFFKLAKLQTAKWIFDLKPGSRKGRAGKIHQVSIRITDICNLRCLTCGQWGENGFLLDKNLRTLKQLEVTPQRYLEIFKDLVENGHHPNIYFWGGEPMLYKGLLEVIDGATKLGLPCSIASNGHLVDQSAQNLVDASLFLMQLSIDGPNQAIHNQLRPTAGTKGSFEDIEAGLDSLIQARENSSKNLPIIASLTVISRHNLPYLAEIYDCFKDRIDLFVFYLSWWITPSRAKEYEDIFESRFGFIPKLHRGWLGDWQVDDFSALAKQMESIKSLSKPWSAPPVTFIPNLQSQEDLHTYYTDHSFCFGYEQCISIYQSVEVDSNGNISPCRDYHDYVVGNIKDKTINELWNSQKYSKFRTSLSEEGLMPVCSRCCGLMGF